MIEKIYNSGEYIDANPTWADDEAIYKFNNLKSFILKNKNLFKKDEIRILDIGFGSGGITDLISNNLFKDKTVLIDAYDISQEAYNIAFSKYGNNKNISFNVGTIEGLQVNIKYDLLICCDVLEHIYDYRAFLEKIDSLTKVGFINMPIEINLLSILRPKVFQNSYKKYGHIHFFNHEYFIFTLNNNGFKIIDTMYSDAYKYTFRSKLTRLIYPFRVFMGFFSRKISTSLFGGYSLQVLFESNEENSINSNP